MLLFAPRYSVFFKEKLQIKQGSILPWNDNSHYPDQTFHISVP